MGGIAIGVIYGSVVYMSTKNYVQTEATITDFKDVTTKGGKTTVHTEVTFDVDGVTHSGWMDFPYLEKDKGKVIDVRYDPADPSKVEGVDELTTFVSIFIVMGVAALIPALFLRNRGKRKKQPPHGPGPLA